MDALSKIGEYFFDDGIVSEAERLQVYQQYKEKQRQERGSLPPKRKSHERSGADRLATGLSSGNKKSIGASTDGRGNNSRISKSIKISKGKTKSTSYSKASNGSNTTRNTAEHSTGTGNVSTTESATTTTSTPGSRNASDASSSTQDLDSTIVPDTVCADLSIRSVSTKSVISESATDSGSGGSQRNHHKHNRKRDPDRDGGHRARNRDKDNYSTSTAGESKSGSRQNDDDDASRHSYHGSEFEEDDEEEDSRSDARSDARSDTRSDASESLERSQRKHNPRILSHPAKRIRAQSRSSSYSRFLFNPFRLGARSTSTATNNNEGTETCDDTVTVEEQRMVDQLFSALVSHASESEEDDDSQSDDSQTTSSSQDSHSQTASLVMSRNTSKSRVSGITTDREAMGLSGSTTAASRIRSTSTNQTKKGQINASRSSMVAIMSATSGFETGFSSPISQATSVDAHSNAALSNKSYKSITSKSTKSKTIHGWIEGNSEARNVRGDSGSGEKIELAITNTDDDDHDVADVDTIPAAAPTPPPSPPAAAAENKKQFEEENNGVAVKKPRPGADPPHFEKAGLSEVISEDSTVYETLSARKSKATDHLKSIFQQKLAAKEVPTTTLLHTALKRPPQGDSVVGATNTKGYDQTSVDGADRSSEQHQQEAVSHDMDDGKQVFMQAFTHHYKMQQSEEDNLALTETRSRSLPVMKSSSLALAYNPKATLPPPKPKGQFFVTNLIVETPTDFSSGHAQNGGNILNETETQFHLKKPRGSTEAESTCNSELARKKRITNPSPSVQSYRKRPVLKSAAVSSCTDTSSRVGISCRLIEPSDSSSYQEYIEVTYESQDWASTSASTLADKGDIEEEDVDAEVAKEEGDADNDKAATTACEDEAGSACEDEAGTEEEDQLDHPAGREIIKEEPLESTNRPPKTKRSIVTRLLHRKKKNKAGAKTPPTPTGSQQQESKLMNQKKEDKADAIDPQAPVVEEKQAPIVKEQLDSELVHPKKKDKVGVKTLEEKQAPVVKEQLDSDLVHQKKKDKVGAKNLQASIAKEQQESEFLPQKKEDKAEAKTPQAPIFKEQRKSELLNKKKKKDTVGSKTAQAPFVKEQRDSEGQSSSREMRTNSRDVNGVADLMNEGREPEQKPQPGDGRTPNLNEDRNKDSLESQGGHRPLNLGVARVTLSEQHAATTPVVKNSGPGMLSIPGDQQEGVQLHHKKESPQKSMISFIPISLRRSMTSRTTSRQRSQQRSLSPAHASRKETVDEGVHHRKKWVRSFSLPRTKRDKIEIVQPNNNDSVNHNRPELPQQSPVIRNMDSDIPSVASGASDTGLPLILPPHPQDKTEQQKLMHGSSDNATEVTVENPWRTGHPNYGDSSVSGARRQARGGSADDSMEGNGVRSFSEYADEDTRHLSVAQRRELKKAPARKFQERKIEPLRNESTNSSYERAAQQSREIPLESMQKVVKFGKVEVGSEKYQPRQGSMRKLKTGVKGILRWNNNKSLDTTSTSRLAIQQHGHGRKLSLEHADNGMQEMEELVAPQDGDELIFQSQHKLTTGVKGTKKWSSKSIDSSSLRTSQQHGHALYADTGVPEMEPVAPQGDGDDTTFSTFQSLRKLKTGVKGILKWNSKSIDVSSTQHHDNARHVNNGTREMELISPRGDGDEDDTFLMQHQMLLNSHQAYQPAFKRTVPIQAGRRHERLPPTHGHSQSKLQRVLGRDRRKKQIHQSESTSNSILDPRANGTKVERLLRTTSYDDSNAADTNDETTLGETTMGAYDVQNQRVLNTLRLLHAVKKGTRKERRERANDADREDWNGNFIDPIIDEIEGAACGARY